ncbi:MAG: Ig-like domain-containing protein [Pyrinomonadaceae bacterium]
MTLPTLPLRAAARLPLCARFVIAVTFAACVVALAPAAHAVEIQIEVAYDSLAQPPAPLSNVCTLRKAVNNANDNAATYPQCQAGEASPVVDTIVFNFSGPIVFALAGANEEGGETGDLDVTDNLIITGHPDGTTIDANDLDRVFHVHPGATLTLRNIHITNGRWPDGGGILVEGGTLVLENCTVSNNYAFMGPGGGIEVAAGGVLNMSNSTVSGNVADDIAGAIQISSGTATITNSTITANSSSSGQTGGINAPAGTTTLRSTILVGNTNGSIVNGVPNFSGALESQGYNVIGDAGTPPNNGTFNAQATDQIGVTPAQVNLGPLQNNGGPTPTHALGAGSVAIDKGHSSGATTDQRGLTRPCDLASVSNAAGGDGGDAGAFEVQGMCGVPAAPPVAGDDAANVAEDSGANALAVLGNDTDPNGDTLTIISVTQGAHGSVAITGGGTGVSYTPTANYNGPDSFNYTVSDGNGGEDTANVSVNVTPVNDAPVASPDAYDTNSNTPLHVVAPGVLGNDSDVDGDVLSAQQVSGPSHALSFALHADGSFDYTPAVDFAGADSFTYRASDGAAPSNTVTVNITVHDTVPPVLNASVGVDSLWPPTHYLFNVGLSVSTSDNSGGPVQLEVAVFSDEDDVTSASGEMSPDARDIAPVTLRLRAERRGDSDGRVYVIRIKATDPSNNSSYSYCTVVVTQNQSQSSLSSVNAQAAAAVAAFAGNGNNPPAGFFIVGDGPTIGPKQ